MKRPGFYLIPLFALLFFASCSNDTADQTSGTTNTASPTVTNAPAPIVPSDAKEKKSDVAVQRLQGKVEVMSETIYFPGNTKKVSTKNVFKYDDNGNRIELSNYKPDGSLNSTIKSIYDANGNITSEQTLLGNGTVDITSTIRTDAKGNRMEQDDKKAGNSNPLFNYKHYFKYDEKGQLIERIANRANGAFAFKYGFKYDDNGNKTEWTRYGPDNSILEKVVYKFDAKNNLIEETKYKPDGSLKEAYTYSYEFDKKNNWIRQKKMQDNTVVEIKEREIKYN
ncbi:MAG TPA: hypothetical protein VFH08_10850 [Chitinophagaceae bacterium]|nr:hypothetical protein [Chitinophagaceae bacterium]